MKNSTRKVVILENLTSPYVKQAIIVLNDYNPTNEKKVIYDAEKIVTDYLNKHGYNNPDNTKIYSGAKGIEKKNKLLSALAFVGIIVLSIGLYTVLN